jgi:hypothetical protein
MKTRTAWDDDEISFAGIGSAYPITEYGTPKKRKRRAKVGFVVLTKKQARAALRAKATRRAEGTK